MFVMKPSASGPGAKDKCKFGIFNVAVDDFAILICKSFCVEIDRVYLEGCLFSNSMSDCFALHDKHCKEKINAFPKGGISISVSVSVRVFLLQKGHT